VIAGQGEVEQRNSGMARFIEGMNLSPGLFRLQLVLNDTGNLAGLAAGAFIYIKYESMLHHFFRLKKIANDIQK
jgi:hypothetical protein